jgi:hypothetical protein
MKAGVKRLGTLVRAGLVVTVGVVAFVLSTGIALAAARTPSHGGPGPNAGGSGGWYELVAVMVLIALAAVIVVLARPSSEVETSAQSHVSAPEGARGGVGSTAA